MDSSNQSSGHPNQNPVNDESDARFRPPLWAMIALGVGALVVATLGYFVSGGWHSKSGPIASSVEADPEEIAKRPLLSDSILTDAAGQQKKLSEFRGNVVILSFWASWCAPCLVELPTFAELEKRYYNQGLRIVAINVDEGSDGKSFAKDFWTRNKLGFPSYFDTSKELVAQYEIEALPSNFVIDRKGRLVFSGFGANDWTSNETTDFLENLIQEKDPPADEG